MLRSQDLFAPCERRVTLQDFDGTTDRPINSIRATQHSSRSGIRTARRIHHELSLLDAATPISSTRKKITCLASNKASKAYTPEWGGGKARRPFGVSSFGFVAACFWMSGSSHSRSPTINMRTTTHPFRSFWPALLGWVGSLPADSGRAIARHIRETARIALGHGDLEREKGLPGVTVFTAPA